MFDKDVEKIFENSVNYEVDHLTKRAPHSQAAFVVYLINQLSEKFKDGQRMSAEGISKLCQLNVATLREVYLEVKKSE